MDTRTGNIIPEDFVKEMQDLARAEKIGALQDRLKEIKEMALPPTVEQAVSMKIGRNNPCPCGSGKKFKKCCLLSGESVEKE